MSARVAPAPLSAEYEDKAQEGASEGKSPEPGAAQFDERQNDAGKAKPTPCCALQ